MTAIRSRKSLTRTLLLAVLVQGALIIPAPHAVAAAPQTTILSGPSGLVTSRTATFRFKSSRPRSTFECKLDGAKWSRCTSPKKYTELAQGAHTFRVRARKRTTVDRTPAVRAFTVDSIKPQTTLDPAPARLVGADWPFTFSSSEPGTFECRLDTASTFAPCTSPFTPESVPDRIYTLQVRARDVAGNVDATPATHQFARVAQMPFNQEIGEAAADLVIPDEVTTDVPASCGGSPAIDCPGGTPLAPTDQIHVTATHSVTKVNGANRYDVTATLDVETLVPMAINVPLAGDCLLDVDSAPGASPTWTLQVQVPMLVDPLTQELYLTTQNPTLSGVASEDIYLYGNFTCQFLSLSIGFYIGLMTDMLANQFGSVGALCMAPGPELFQICPWVPL